MLTITFTNALKTVFFFPLPHQKSFLGTKLFCSFFPFELFILSFNKYLSGDKYGQNIMLDAARRIKDTLPLLSQSFQIRKKGKEWKTCESISLYFTVSLCQLFGHQSFPNSLTTKGMVLLSSQGLTKCLNICGIHYNELLHVIF